MIIMSQHAFPCILGFFNSTLWKNHFRANQDRENHSFSVVGILITWWCHLLSNTPRFPGIQLCMGCTGSFFIPICQFKGVKSTEQLSGVCKTFSSCTAVFSIMRSCALEATTITDKVFPPQLEISLPQNLAFVQFILFSANSWHCVFLFSLAYFSKGF